MRILKFFFVLVLLAGIAGAGTVGLAIWYFGRDLPNYKQLANYQPPIVTRVHAADGRLMAEYATEKRIFVPVKSMPPLVIHAFLAAEDKNFYSHPGIDPLSMLRAAATDIMRLHSNRRPIGASTITQQVAKNFLLNNQLSLERKIREALVAVRMEQVLSKDRILELYLNGIYLGGGTYGVAAAALNYFNKSLDELTVQEAAFLAALPKAPNNYNPQRYPEAARDRRDWVIDRMVDAHFVTAQQGVQAKSTPIVLHHRDNTETVQAPYFTEEVRRELLARFGETALYTSGLSVRTSLDPALQVIATHSLRDALIAYDRRHGYRGAVTQLSTSGDWQARLAARPLPPGVADVSWKLGLVLATSADGATIGLADGSQGRIPLDELRWARKELPDNRVGPVPTRAGEVLRAGNVVLVEPLDSTAGKTHVYALRQIPEVSGALVAMDPHTGRVLAMTGGFSYDISQFDRATQAKRQTGSAIKPIVYLAALDHGFTPSTIVLDGPISLDQGPGLPKWSPVEFEHKFFGPVPLMVGLAESLNLVTARVGQAIGIDTVAQYIERFGILEHMPLEYSFVLGAGETTPLKLTTAYAMLDNGGKRIAPTFIDRVQDRNGTTIYRADDRPCDGCNNVAWTGQAPPTLPDTREQIADPRSTYQDVFMMEGVVLRGTGRSVSVIGKPIAGKTGTTNESNDTWFVGFSPDLVAGVYVGFDQPRSLGAKETGASVAAPAFREFMAAALQDKPAVPFRIPPGIEEVRVDPRTGQLASASDKNSVYAPYKPGTEPGSQPSVVAGTDDGTDAVSAMPASAAVPGDGLTGDGTSSGLAAPAAQATPAGGTGGLY